MFFVATTMVACGNSEGVEDEPNEKPEPKPEPEPEPEPLTFKFEAELVSASTSSAEVKLTTENIAQYAYVVETADANIAPDLIFATGTVGDCKDGENIVTVTSLNPNTDYVVLFAAATVEEEYYENLAKVTLKTGSFTEELTFFDVDYMSVKAHLNYPHDKVKEGNVLKWAIAEFPVYYENMQARPAAEALNLNDNAWHNYITDDTTWTFSELESYMGKEEDPEAVPMYDAIVPGQPMYLMLGEYAWDTTDYAGWGDGYYAAQFDFAKYLTDKRSGAFENEADYWTGYYRREFFESKAPSKMSAKPEVSMNLTPIGGTITITPTDGIYGFCCGIMDPTTYMELLPLLNNESKYVQWYITSMHAFASGMGLTGFGKTTINLTKYFNLYPGISYTLYITSLGDENGSKQSFAKHTFKLPDPTEPAAKFSLQGVSNPDGEDTCDKVWFNIKLTEGTLLDGKVIANYERDWAALLNSYKKSGYSDEEALNMIIDTYGVAFSDEEIAAIKTDEGLNIYYSSRADASTVCGIRMRNSEGVVTVTSAAMRSIKEPAATPVTSTLFDDLKGEWTASTTISYLHYHYRQNPAEGQEHNYQERIEEPISCKVVIGEVGYEQTLPESVYQLFFDSSNLKTKEEVDAVYAQFKTSVDDFNAHVRNQNRLLCQGFSLEHDLDLLPCANPEHTDKPNGVIDTQFASPYELFIADADTYSAYNYESPVFDFGPKWYLQIHSDGSVTAPFDTNYFSPMSQWYKYVYHFMGASSKYTLPNLSDVNGNSMMGHFPVVVSEDKNTITINPIELTYVTTDDMGNVNGSETDLFYPNIVREASSGFISGYQVHSRIIAPIVLTRGYTAPAAKAATASTGSGKIGKIVDTELKSVYKVAPKKAIYKSRTALPTNAVVAPTNRVDYRIISADEFKQRSQEYAEKRFGRN